MSERDTFRVWTCGCVLSNQSLKELGCHGDKECPSCGSEQTQQPILLQQPVEMQDQFMKQFDLQQPVLKKRVKVSEEPVAKRQKTEQSEVY